MRFGAVAYPVDRRKGRQDLPLLTVSQYRGVLLRSDTTDDESRAEDLSNYKVVQKGQLVINRMSAYNGALGVSPVAGVASPDYMVLQLRSGQHGPFWEYLMRSAAFVTEIGSRVRGIGTLDAKNVRTPRISYGELKLIEVPSYSFEEQVAIAGYLDQETALIDQLIGKQNALIERLRERRAAVTEEAVNSSGPRAALGHYVSTLPGFAFASDGFSSDAEDVPLMRGVNVKPDGISWEQSVYWPREQIPQVRRYLLSEGDIVLGLDRPFVRGGTRVQRLGRMDAPSLLLQRVVKLTPRKMDPDFLTLVLQSRAFREYAEPEFTGVSVPHLSDKQVRDFRCPIPSQAEQREIASDILSRTAKISALIAKAEAHIKLARERRAALITAAVAGHIVVGAA